MHLSNYDFCVSFLVNGQRILLHLKKIYPITTTLASNVRIIVGTYEGGFENILPPQIQKLKHEPENEYWDGEYQSAKEDDKNVLEAVVLVRKFRDV